MYMPWELYFQEVIKGQRQGFLPGLIRVLLKPLSWLFQLIVWGRNWLYDHGWLCCYNPPVKVVISIGNIVAGGTGKTPVTLMLAKIFYDRFPIAIISRGYKSPAERLPSPLVLCEGEGPQYPAAESGDEPYLLAQHLPHAYVFVGKDKRQAARMAASAGVDMIFIDDGMQHRKIVRDFDIAIVDAADPFGKGFFLPRGFLREGVTSLSRVNLVIINHVDSEAQYQAVEKQIRCYTAAPIVGMQWHLDALLDLQGNKIISLKGKKVGMFCGIAHPESFRQTLSQQGADIVEEAIFPDHTAPEAEEIALFAKRCAKNGAEWIVCTEKDKVKLDEKVQLSIPIIWVQMKLEVVNGLEAWNTFLKKVESKLF